jgi:hypothetical protein
MFRKGGIAVDKRFDPIKWAKDIIPRNQSQLEVLVKRVLRVAFWVALLAPVVLVPIYYLILAVLR